MPEGNIAFDVGKMMADMEARLQASPHRCRGQCGEKVLHQGQVCGPCDERLLAEGKRRDAIRSTEWSIPEEHRWAHLGVLEARPAVAVARKIDVATIGRIVLEGGAGAGKSTLAVCLLREWSRQTGRRGMFVECRELARARQDHRLGETPPLVTQALSANLIVLDDLGADKPDEHGDVADVIHLRHSRKRSTIITTGKSPEYISSAYGDGCGRRVYQGALRIAVGISAAPSNVRKIGT